MEVPTSIDPNSKDISEFLSSNKVSLVPTSKDIYKVQFPGFWRGGWPCKGKLVGGAPGPRKRGLSTKEIEKSLLEDEAMDQLEEKDMDI